MPSSPHTSTMISTHDHRRTISDSDSNSDDENGGSESLRHLDLSDSIFKAYFEFTGRSTTTADLSKIQSFLTSSSSGALSCLICLERIRLSDPTWSCSSLCFAVFHLFCIQSWARQASTLTPRELPHALSSPPISLTSTLCGTAPNAESSIPNLQFLRSTFVSVGN